MTKPDNDRPADLLDWLRVAKEPNWGVARPLGGLIGAVLVIVIPLLFVGALAAAAAVLLQTLRAALGGSDEGIALGSGALIAAMLGAPFVIWGTIIKHRALGFQKEGHLTDRISKAVEQLGADKVVSRPMRNVTYSHAGETHSVFEGRDELVDLPKGATEVKRGEWEIVQRTVPNIEVRIGGILSLERIAQDSTAYDHGRDHVRVMEILCAYVRENAPASGAKDHEFGEWVPLKDDATEAERAAHLRKLTERVGSLFFQSLVFSWAHTLPPQREDLAIALRVIGRRTAAQLRVEAAWPAPPRAETRWAFETPCPTLRRELGRAGQSSGNLAVFLEKLHAWEARMSADPGYRPDLRNTNLQRADLSDLNFAGVHLDHARIDGAKLIGVRMDGAQLDLASMMGAELNDAAMQGASLWRAQLEGANLDQAKMQGASLWGAQLEGAKLSGARLEGADLGSARMEGARLWRAHIEGAILHETWMSGAYLSDAQMQGAYLRDAKMQGAYLSGAQVDATTLLDGVDLSEAAVYEIDLSSVSISADQVASMFGDASVILPPGIARPAHWPTGQLDDFAFLEEWRKWQADPATYTPPPAPAP